MNKGRIGILIVILGTAAGAWGATLLGSYPSPGPRPDGLGYNPAPYYRLTVTTWDVNTGDKVYFIVMPTTGSITASFPLVSYRDVYGSDYGYVAPNGYIFVASGRYVSRYRSGNLDGTIDTLITNTRGVAFNNSGSYPRLILTEGVPNGRLWEMNPITGNRYGDYMYLGFQPYDLGYDGVYRYYWIADTGNSCVRKVTTNGSTVGSFTVGFVPYGVAADNNKVYVGRRSPDYIYRYDVTTTELTAASFGKVKALFH